MSLAHRYHELHEASGDVSPTEIGSSDATAEANLEAFEKGYQAGWQDASDALESEQRRISADFSQTLQDMSFTYHEARSKILLAIKPVIDATMTTLIPGVIGASLKAYLIEQIQDLIEKSTENAIEFVVSEKNVEMINSLLHAQNDLPFSVRSEANVGDGQFYLKVNNTERCVDMDALRNGISDSFSSFFNQTFEVEKNG